jgi:hypothetical protein
LNSPRKGLDLTQSVIMQVRMQNTTIMPANIEKIRLYNSYMYFSLYNRPKISTVKFIS